MRTDGSQSRDYIVTTYQAVNDTAPHYTLEIFVVSLLYTYKGGETSMTDQHDQKGGISPTAAGAIGAVVGAAAVVAAGVAVMANKDGRKKVEKAIDAAKDKVEDIKEGVGEKLAEGHEKVQDAVAAVKDATHDVVKAVK